eukprot:12930461-Alexandrium_andersonii.AAC.1
MPHPGVPAPCLAGHVALAHGVGAVASPAAPVPAAVGSPPPVAAGVRPSAPAVPALPVEGRAAEA